MNEKPIPAVRGTGLKPAGIIFFLALWLAFWIAIAPAGQAGSANAVSRGGDTIRLSLDHNGSQIDLKPGDRLEITLEGNPTTGYLWEAEALDTEAIVLEGPPEYRTDRRSDRPIAGAGGVFLFRFRALGAGSADLKLKYHRPFEKETPPIRTFMVRVRVGSCP